MSLVTGLTNAAADVPVVSMDIQRRSVAETARQFEALLIGFMLKSVREASSSSWLGAGEDSATASAMGFAEERLAEVLASSGGLGMADMISAGLTDQTRLTAADGAISSEADIAAPGTRK